MIGRKYNWRITCGYSEEYQKAAETFQKFLDDLESSVPESNSAMQDILQEYIEIITHDADNNDEYKHKKGERGKRLIDVGTDKTAYDFGPYILFEANEEKTIRVHDARLATALGMNAIAPSAVTADGKFALIEKAPGKRFSDCDFCFENKQLLNDIPQEHFDKLMSDIFLAHMCGFNLLNGPVHANNLFYCPEKGFTIIDIFDGDDSATALRVSLSSREQQSLTFECIHAFRGPMIKRQEEKEPLPEFVIKLARALDKIYVPVNDGKDVEKLNFLDNMIHLSNEDKAIIKNSLRSPIRLAMNKGKSISPIPLASKNIKR